MDENTTQTPEADVNDAATEEQTPTRLQVFVTKHPRAAKITAITGAVTAVVGTACVVKTLKTNRQHLVAAGDHAKEALNELSTSVSPQDPEA